MAQYHPSHLDMRILRQQFKVPMAALAKTADAQANMQEKFDRHKCNREDAEPKPCRTPGSGDRPSN
jgi:hypothetical protein